MFSKAWRWLAARLNGRQQDRLRFVVHRDSTYESFWRPAEGPGGQPHLEIQIYLQATNMAEAARWIVAAELAGMPALQTIIGVRDAGTRAFAPDNPLPGKHITTVSLHFVIDGRFHPSDEPFHAAVMLTDHLGGQHFVKVIMH